MISSIFFIFEVNYEFSVNTVITSVDNVIESYKQDEQTDLSEPMPVICVSV